MSVPAPLGGELFASVPDVQDAYEGEIPEDREGWVHNLLERAQRLLLAHRPHLHEWVAAGRVDADAAGDALVAAVLRVVRNPAGMQSETEGNYLYSVARDVAGGKLFFTGDDLALVTPRAGSRSGRSVGTIRLGLAHRPARLGGWR